MKGMLMCDNCGETVNANDAVMFQGKTFCSQECKQDSITQS